MSQWGGTDSSANSTMFAAWEVGVDANTTNRAALYGNTTLGAFKSGAVVGQVGIDASEAATLGINAGWTLKTSFSGFVNKINVVAGGSAYSNSDVITVAADASGSNAAATLVTNATGGIVSVTVTNPGSGFVTLNPTVTVANSTGGSSSGSSATLTATLGGRAGRVQYETLVAIGSLT